MKAAVSILFAIAMQAGYTSPADTNEPAQTAQRQTSSAPQWATTMPRWDEWVIVRSLKEDLPAKDPGIWQYLATNFIGSFETEAFSTVITAHYGYWLPQLEKGLIAKAKRESLDAESLELCLVVVSNRLDREKLAYIPVAAYSARQGGIPVWIIVVKWEQVHYQVFALDARTRNVIGFATCN